MEFLCAKKLLPRTANLICPRKVRAKSNQSVRRAKANVTLPICSEIDAVAIRVKQLEVALE